MTFRWAYRECNDNRRCADLKSRIAQIWFDCSFLIFFNDVFVVVFGDNHIVADCVIVFFKTRKKPTVADVICNINDSYFIVFTTIQSTLLLCRFSYKRVVMRGVPAYRWWFLDVVSLHSDKPRSKNIKTARFSIIVSRVTIRKTRLQYH